MKVLVCDDSLTGVYSGIYEAWAGKYDRDMLELKIDGAYEYELFKEYIRVEADEVGAEKVMNTIENQFGARFMTMVTMAIWSSAEDKADVVYKTIKYGIENRLKGNFLSNLRMDYIQRVNSLYTNVNHEIHHFYGFLRFSELQKDFLFAQIHPHNYCLEALSEHFADRLPAENWIIYDDARNIAAFHHKHKPWYIVRDVFVDNERITNNLSDSEVNYRKLWKCFFDSIAIKERENVSLQRNNLPLRFRGFMTEFF